MKENKTILPNNKAVANRLLNAKQLLEMVSKTKSLNNFDSLIHSEYYACFYAVTALLRKLFIVFSSHKEVKQLVDF